MLNQRSLSACVANSPSSHTWSIFLQGRPSTGALGRIGERVAVAATNALATQLTAAATNALEAGMSDAAGFGDGLFNDFSSDPNGQ